MNPVSQLSLYPLINKTAVLEQRVFLLQQELSELRESQKIKDQFQTKIISVLKDNCNSNQVEKEVLKQQLTQYETRYMSTFGMDSLSEFDETHLRDSIPMFMQESPRQWGSR